jgi:hypothetical protein
LAVCNTLPAYLSEIDTPCHDRSRRVMAYHANASSPYVQTVCGGAVVAGD